MEAIINGYRMNLTLQGDEDGPAIIFIHGFPFSLEMWKPQLEALPHHYRAIAYDVRGHGGSDVGDGQYTLELFVDDLMALMDHLSLDTAVVCGLSMGGYITLRAVERHPERFRAMVLCDNRSEADTNEARTGRTATIQAIQAYGIRPFADEFVEAVLAPDTLLEQPELVGRVRDMILANQPAGICGTLLALAGRTDTTAALPEMDLPTLIMVGENDALTPPADARRMQARLPQAKLHVIPDAGHLSNLENPAIFNENLLGFLRRSSSSSGSRQERKKKPPSPP